MSNTPDIIKRFYKLFEKYDFYCNTFYVSSKTNACKFIGCIHALTGYRVLIDIPDDMNIIFDKHVSSTIDNILLFEEQALEVLDNDIIDDMFVANKYKGDDMFENKIDITSHNLDNVLIEEYKFNLKLDHHSAAFKYHLNDIVKQLDRIKHIISPITHYGLAIESKNMLVYTQLHSNTIRAMKLNKPPRDSRILYIILSLDSFYDKRKTIIDTVNTIHKGILNVLNHNFTKHKSLLKTLINKCTDSIDHIEYIHNQQTSYEEELLRLDDVQVTDDVLNRANLLGKIDCISLCIDKIMFDNVTSYNTIVNNYELLIKMSSIL